MVAGCADGAGSGERFRVEGGRLTIYSSVPRAGESSEQAAAVVAGQRLALADRGGRAGRYRVRLVELDSSNPDEGGWDAGLVEAGAERAADDPTTIAYLGELDFGGSAVSVPVTNDAGILQISPGDGLTGLTRERPGSLGAGPERYYPRGRRTFARLVPADELQAESLVEWARQLGARRLVVMHDQGLFGRDLAPQLRAAAEREGLVVASVLEARVEPDGYGDIAREVAKSAPQAVVYAGAGRPLAGPLLAAVHRAVPGARLLAAGGVPSAGLGDGSHADQERGARHGEPGSGDPSAEVLLLRSTLPPGEIPPEGRRILSRLSPSLRGEAAAGTPPVEAVYGYESMRLVLDAIEHAGSRGADRRAVTAAALEPRIRRSVIGPYRLLRSGEVSVRRFSAYRLRGGRLELTGARTPRR